MSKLKYGVTDGIPQYTTEGTFLASDVISKKSGRYVVYDISDGYWRAVNDGEAVVGGYIPEDATCSTTSVDKFSIATNVDQFSTEMPYSFDGAAATLTQAVLNTLIGKFIDIYVANNIQYADNRTTVADSLFIVTGGSVAENTLKVKVSSSKMGQTG